MKPNLLDLWYAALASPYGIEVGCSPDFDSGEGASPVGLLDLTGTAYAGSSDGATTYWTARAKGAERYDRFVVALGRRLANGPGLLM